MALLHSFNSDRVRESAESYSGLPFTVLEVRRSDITTDPATPTPKYHLDNTFDTKDGVSVMAAVAVVLVLSVLALLGIIWWGRRRCRHS